MRKFIKSILFIIPFLLLSSCATILLPSEQKVTINTSSKDAKVYIKNEKFGEGLSSTNKINKGEVQEIAIVYGNEFAQKNDVIIPSNTRSTGFIVCQIINSAFILVLGAGIYGIIYDSALSKAYKYPKIIDLKSKPIKLPVRTEVSKYVYLSNIRLDIHNADQELKWHTAVIKKDLKSAISDAESKSLSDKKRLEIIEAKRKKKVEEKERLNDKENDLSIKDVIYTDDLKKILYKGGWYDTINNVFIDNNNVMIIEGKVSQLDLFEISANSNLYSGKIYTARTKLTWYLKNAYYEIIDSIADISFSENFADDKDIIKKIVGSSLTQSFYNLFENSKFKKNSKIETDFKLNTQITQLNKPRSIVVDKGDATEASVIIKTKSGHGSGFAITNDGYIITNYHVLVNREKGSIEDDFTVIDLDGNEMKGKLVKVNKYRDVVLLKVDKNFSKAFYCSDTKSFKKLDNVFTIGAPKSVTLGQSISAGLISNERNVNNNNLIQLNMSVNSGNSGGPVFDNLGNLHGVVVSKLVGENTEGVSFAIPSYKLLEYLNLKY
ncbi:MAG TPA: serine protease [Saprospiraceae bacterium]|nr:serine protease [Saprospiraceae bacterium]